MYLRYKLFWDCTLDSDVLTDNWFNACFAEAAPIMKKYFNSINQFTLSALNRAGFDEYYIGYNYMQSDLWSITIIYEWFDYIEDAMSVIQMNYQDSDPEYYEIIKRNILFEAVWPATALSVMFNPTSGGDRFVKIIKYFADNEGTYFKDFGRLPERQFRDTSLI